MLSLALAFGLAASTFLAFPSDALALKKTDSSESDRTVWVDKGDDSGKVNFGGSTDSEKNVLSTNVWRVDGVLGYCVDPGTYGNDSGYEKARVIRASDFTSEQVYRAFIAALYYSPGNPGWDSLGKTLVPEKAATGEAMTERLAYGNSHVLLGYYYNEFSWDETWRWGHTTDWTVRGTGDYKSYFLSQYAPGTGSSWATADTFGSKAIAHANDEDMMRYGGYTFDDFASKVLVVTASSGNSRWFPQDLVAWTGEPPARGQISLAKHSANPSVTDGNACYSLKGAKYGIFGSEADAASRDESKAVYVGTTGQANSDGTQVDDYFNTGMNIYKGDYWVAEISPSKGYALDANVYKVTVTAQNDVRVNGSKGYVEEIPIGARLDAVLGKTDVDTGIAEPQGGASLAGAEFTVRYYDGCFDESTLPPEATRSWTLGTDANGVARLTDESRMGGSDYYRDLAGAPTIPLGTIAIVETKAPQGYNLDDGDGNAPKTYVAQVVQTGDGEFDAVVKSVNYSELIGQGNAPAVPDSVKRGGIEVPKVDREDGQAKPLGAATLAGAEMQIVLDSGQPVVVDGSVFRKGDVVKTIVTREDGTAVTGPYDLPYGTYIVRESKAPEGYLLNTEWSAVVQVLDNGEVYTASPVADQVKRGDIRFNKANGETMARLPGVAFLVTSKATGESHVVVADENGSVDTSAAWAPHAQGANKNDAALAEIPAIEADGQRAHEVDSSKLDYGAGVWFSGRTDLATDPDDTLGALPYDTYTFRELASEANDALELVEFDVRVYRDSYQVDMGTVDDSVTVVPSVETELADRSGSHSVPAAGSVELVDTVYYHGLRPGGRYVLTGTLMDKETGAPALQGGEPIVSTAAFRAADADGSAEVVFRVDASQMAGKRLVAFQELADADGYPVAEHCDLDDADQTVSLPAIGTVLTSPAGGKSAVNADGTVRLLDRVDYANLEPGREYTMEAELHAKYADGSDAGVAADRDGNPITGSATFVPETPDGSVTVEYEFPYDTARRLEAVAFETLVSDGVAFAEHKDIADPDQTATVTPGATPSIKTRASEKEGGSNELPAGMATATDKVSFEGLEPGANYVLKATLMDKETSAPATLDGEEIRAELRFAPEDSAGVVVMEFASADYRPLAGKRLVAFEELYRVKGEDDADDIIEGGEGASDEPVAVHKDLDDPEQTLTVASLPEQKEAPEPVSTPTKAKQADAPSAKGGMFDQTGNVLARFWWIPLLLLGVVGMSALLLCYIRRDTIKRGDPW